MSALFRSGTVGTAVVGLIVYVITRYQAIINDRVLIWVLVGGGAALVSLVFSWAVTYGIRVQFVDVDFKAPPSNINVTNLADLQARRDAWLAQVKRAKRMLMLCSQLLCLLPAEALGIVIQLVHVPEDVRLVYWTVWAICAATLAAASPYLWRLMFDWVWPWMLAKEKSAT